MKLLYLSQKEEEKIKKALKVSDKVHTIIISSGHGKFRKGDYVKTANGERLLVTDTIILKDFDEFKKDFIRYPELRDTNLEEIKKAFTHKKIEIIELRRYRK